ncbi:uncharacterized protein LOC129717098 [Wyeomyia smithii]|uniref:uncharacterized protein LOC129717098 n=1 Tax=Wyeomyia smithii TaxID=174621 RepID=UPI002467C0A4|nr:uncharacterized protein LOC129717098 [Wyeomyia smithii]
MTEMSFMKIPRIKAFFQPQLRCDHNMVVCIMRRNSTPENLTQRYTNDMANDNTRKRRYNVEALRVDEEKRKRFQNSIDKNLRKYSEIEGDNKNIQSRWKRIKLAVTDAANAILTTPASPPTPRRKIASRKYTMAQQKRLAERDNVLLKKAAAEARIEKRKAYDQHFNEKVDGFLNSIEKENSLEQMTQTFRFIKRYKRNKQTRKAQYISIQKWEQKLHSLTHVQHDINTQYEVENDYREAGPVPTAHEIAEIIMTSRNNSAPGLDNLQNEFLKYGSEQLLQEITDLMIQIFKTNIVPKEWSETVQVPIPKIPYPKNVDDYRCTILCTSTYKIYAKLLLNRLRQQVPPLPGYQMAFQHKRSAPDQIFVLRRIMDEKWRKGKKIVLVSLDLKQAFDRIDTSKMAVILSDMGVSKALIRRIVTGCLREITSINGSARELAPRRKLEASNKAALSAHNCLFYCCIMCCNRSGYSGTEVSSRRHNTTSVHIGICRRPAVHLRTRG